jgi:hypothetical protein
MRIRLEEDTNKHEDGTGRSSGWFNGRNFAREFFFR